MASLDGNSLGLVIFEDEGFPLAAFAEEGAGGHEQDAVFMPDSDAHLHAVAVTQGGGEGALLDPETMDDGDQHQADRAGGADPVPPHQPHAGEEE